LGEYAEGLKKAVQKRKVGEEPFKQDMYVADLGQIKQLAEDEGKAFEKALKTLRERLNEYADWYGLGDLLNVEEGKARELAEAGAPELSEFNDVGFGVKALAALIAYREYALGRRSAFGTAAGYWLEVGGSAWLFYYPPWTAYLKAEKAKGGETRNGGGVGNRSPSPSLPKARRRPLPRLRRRARKKRQTSADAG
jgi:hypothetical protein